MREKGDRQRAEESGRRAETIAAWYLRLKGFRILARRYKTPVGEIDLIVRRGGLVAFVEVKRRGSAAEAAEAVSAPAQQRIARAAAAWLAAHPAAAGLALRFDVVIAVPGRLPRHIAGAFDATGVA